MERLSIFSSDNREAEQKVPGVYSWHLLTSPILDLGLTDYRGVHKLQLEIHSSIALNNAKEVIIINEHFPVYTCGRTTKPQDRPAQTSIPIIDIERGGELTYHGPGQIVGYPILNLAKRRLSIPQYLRRLEQALIEALREGGVEARYREECRAGLWIAPPPVLGQNAHDVGRTGGGVGDKKVASIGIAVRRWVTFHGFALNVDCDLQPFKIAKPCGMSGDQVTSLKELGYNLSKEKVREWVKAHLMRAFF